MIPARLGAVARTTRTPVAVVAITQNGIAPSTGVTGDPVHGHVVVNDGRVVVVARNVDGGNAHTVARNLPPVDGQAVVPVDVLLPAGATCWLKIGHPAVAGRKVRLDVDSSQVKLSAYEVEVERL